MAFPDLSTYLVVSSRIGSPFAPRYAILPQFHLLEITVKRFGRFSSLESTAGSQRQDLTRRNPFANMGRVLYHRRDLSDGVRVWWASSGSAGRRVGPIYMNCQSSRFSTPLPVPAEHQYQSCQPTRSSHYTDRYPDRCTLLLSCRPALTALHAFKREFRSLLRWWSSSFLSFGQILLLYSV